MTAHHNGYVLVLFGARTPELTRSKVERGKTANFVEDPRSDDITCTTPCAVRFVRPLYGHTKTKLLYRLAYTQKRTCSVGIAKTCGDVNAVC